MEIPVDTLILEGVRRLDEWQRIRKIVPDPRWIPKVVRAFDVRSMGPLDLAILREINGRNSIEQIARNCRTATFNALNFVFHGLENGVLQMRPPDGGPEKIPGLSKGSWRLLLKDAERLIKEGELLEAYRALRGLEEKFGDQRRAHELAEGLRREIQSTFEKEGLDDRAVPEVTVSMAELTKVQCAPEEGFLLSRINGIYTLGEVLKLLPGDPVEKRLLVKGLLDRNLLRLKGAS